MKYITAIAILCFCITGWADSAKEPSITERIGQISNKITVFSGSRFPVFVEECKFWGEARADGTIVIDRTIVQKQPYAVTAFLLAHEWGHQLRAQKQPHAKTDGFAVELAKNRRKEEGINAQAVGAAMWSRGETGRSGNQQRHSLCL